EPAPLHRKSVLAVFFLNKASVTETIRILIIY
ncbi:hypothetical protein ECEC1870_2127, partial [Escherichia coli EC1870]